MPRVYKRKTDWQSWTEDQLEAAKNAILSGTSINAASLQYRIPRSTIVRRMSSPRKPKKMGSKDPVFTREQEQEILKHLMDMEVRFYGLTMKDVRKLAFDLAEKNHLKHSFNKEKGLAGRDWLRGFLKRNPTLSFRKPEATSIARARGFNRTSVNAFFDMLDNTTNNQHFPPSRIFNADETGVSTVIFGFVRMYLKTCYNTILFI